ncbi:MAG: hypothetical protein HPY74_02875 [Firmicutes bacterium]|nr:hypothetical protein [Bacillota bacterium]
MGEDYFNYNNISRKEFLQKYFKLRTEYERVLINREFFSDEEAEEINKQDDRLEILLNEIDAWEKEYLKHLPYVNISRSPFTGQILNISIDTGGIDGPWWEYDRPLRNQEERIETFLCIDGAMKLEGEIEKSPFLVKPGPEVPFIIPSLLSQDNVRAVISSLKIGKHTGYPIVYYAVGAEIPEERTNDWGSNYYRIVDDEGIDRFLNSPILWFQYDYDLKPWIMAGKLFWIKPGDYSLTLRADWENCPYLNLECNKRLPQIIIDGSIEYAEEEDEDENIAFHMSEEEVDQLLKEIREGGVE